MCSCEGDWPGSGSQPKQGVEHVHMGMKVASEGQSIRSLVKRAFLGGKG